MDRWFHSLLFIIHPSDVGPPLLHPRSLLEAVPPRANTRRDLRSGRMADRTYRNRGCASDRLGTRLAINVPPMVLSTDGAHCKYRCQGRAPEDITHRPWLLFPLSALIPHPPSSHMPAPTVATPPQPNKAYTHFPCSIHTPHLISGQTS